MSIIYQGVIERYRKYLPVNQNTPVVTLYEGDTPLLPAENLARLLGVKNLEIYLKYEGLNPTGSFKDRGMTVAVSKAKEAGAKAVLCASTGNTAASAAAYAAKAGIRGNHLKCIVLVPSGKVALGKLSQALIYGAKVIALDGNFDQALQLAREICEKYPITLVNSVNPYRIEGQKTAAFEIIDALGFAPDYQFMPVGNAGNITAYWKGYQEFANGKFLVSGVRCQVSSKKNLINSLHFTPHTLHLPKMMGFQAEGAAPIVKGHPINKPKTVATAIRIGNPASWEGAVKARDESGGVIDTVSDKEILDAYQLLASQEGLFVEPASAASVAGLIKYIKKGFFNYPTIKLSNHPTIIVCILTGHGLKDPKQAIKISLKPKIIPPELKSVLKEAGI